MRGDDFNEVLDRHLADIQAEDSTEQRAHLLKELARTCENEWRDPERAFAVLLAAYREQPERALWGHLERLAELADGWSELVDILGDAVPRLEPADRADAWIHIGALYEQRLSHPDYALVCYRSAVSCDRASSEARRRLETLLRARGEFAELARLLADRLEAAPDLERHAIAVELAGLHARLNNREEAIARYEELRSEAPGDLEVLQALEDLYTRERRVHQLLEVLEAQASVVQGARDLARLYQRMATEWEQQLGSTEKAEECLEWVLHYDPNNEDAFRALERLYRADRLWPQAVDVYQRHAAIASPVKRIELHSEVARICERELKDAAGAIEFYRRIEADRPGSIDAMSGPIRLYERTEDFEQMAAVLERKAVKAEGRERAELYYRAGELNRTRLKNLEHATHLFVRALESSPSYVPAMVGLAECYREAGKLLNAASLLEEAIGATSNRLERTRLLVIEAGVRAKLDDRERAIELYDHALALDPEHVEAAAGLVEQLARNLEFKRMRAPLELLAAKEPDATARVGRLLQLAKVEEQLGNRERALGVLERATTLHAGHLGALQALANLLFRLERFGEAYAVFLRAGERAPELLTDEQVELHFQLGVCARKLGKLTARDHFAAALALDPEHRPSLRAQIELDQALPDQLFQHYGALLKNAPLDEEVQLYTAIGDLCATLGEPAQATAYRQALALAPDDHRLLHKCLDAAVERKDWIEALSLLERLIAREKVAKVRARYCEAAGLICYDELVRTDDALRFLSAAIGDDATLERAADGLEEIYFERADWVSLANLHGARLQQLGPVCPAGQEMLRARLWARFGEVCLHRLGERDNALAAFEVAARFAPGDVGVHRELAQLHADMQQWSKAIASLQRVIALDAGDALAYQGLEELYRRTGQPAKAEACAEARGFLERRRDPSGSLERDDALPRAIGALRPEQWEGLHHGDEDRDLSALFALLTPVVASAQAQPLERLGLDRRDRVERRDERPFARALKYAAAALAVPMPDVYIRYDQLAPAVVAVCRENKHLVPVLVVGTPLLGHKRSERDLVFHVARQLAYLCPGRILRVLAPHPTQLASLIDAAMALGGEASPAPRRGNLAAVIQRLKASLSADALAEVAALGRTLHARGIRSEEAARAWLRAVDLTVARIALLLVGDLDTCARVIGAEPAPFGMMPDERILDLVAASISEGMFAARTQLGFARAERRAAPRTVESHHKAVSLLH
jgi:golgin subfamily B member 1